MSLLWYSHPIVFIAYWILNIVLRWISTQTSKPRTKIIVIYSIYEIREFLTEDCHLENKGLIVIRLWSENYWAFIKSIVK